MALQGYQTIGSSGQLVAAGGADGYLLQKITVVGTLYIGSINAAVSGSAGTNATVYASIYSDSSGSLGTELYTTSASVPTSTSATIEEFIFSSPPTLTSGDYWIGIKGLYNGAGTATVYYDTGGAANSAAHQTSDIDFSPTYEAWNVSAYIHYYTNDTGWVSPPSGSITNDATIGTVAWTGPENAYASNDFYATTPFDYHQSPEEYEVKIVKSDGTIGTENKTTQPEIFNLSDTYFSYGGTTDLWGETWLYSDINDADFGFVFAIYDTWDLSISNYIKAVNFGINIPAGSTIDGIEARIERSFTNEGPLGTNVVNVDHMQLRVYYTQTASARSAIASRSPVSSRSAISSRSSISSRTSL